MPFNLITTPWIEVRRLSGQRSVIRPQDVTDQIDADPILALDFPRPDFNAAVTEWLIGLTFLALAPEDAYAWGDHFHQPPSPDTLAAAFAPLAPHFNLDGDGPRAFQDFETLGNAEVKALSGLLIDAPGENALENNSDLFVKRGGAETMSLAQAAAALVTLQTYAPSSGRGYRTSMRGGGPLTTLVTPVRKGAKVVNLWDRIWANVPYADPDAPTDIATALPWLTLTLSSEADAVSVTPEGRHPALAFFACPRRIRLIFKETAEGVVTTGYRTLTYGANYLTWLHPLTPYYRNKTSERLARHPKAGAANYGDWLAWWGLKESDESSPALCLKSWIERRQQTGGALARTLVEAFGYDMDKAKARQWLEARLPLVTAHEGELRSAVSQMIAGSHVTARELRASAQLALYGQREGRGYKLPKKFPRDALPLPAERLWLATQLSFEEFIDRLDVHLRDGTRAPTAEFRREWLKVLHKHALPIFDETVDLEGLTNAEPRRLLHARDKLQFALSNNPKAPVLKALDLTPETPVRASELARGAGG